MCMSLVQRSKVRGGVASEGSSAGESSSDENDEEIAEDTSHTEKAEGTLVTMAMAKTWVQQLSKVCLDLCLTSFVHCPSHCDV